MKSLRTYTFFFFLTLPLFAQQQHQFPILIERVELAGNRTTKAEVILREIPFTFPDSLSLEDLQLIQNRVTNLLLFNLVELAILPEGRKNVLLIHVTESWYIYPVPIFFINDREWDRISVGFQVSHLNFRGMHELLSVGGWLGYNPTFFINYDNPWVGKKTRFIFGFSLFGKWVSNRFFDVREQHLGGRISIGKRFSLTQSMQLTFSLRRIAFPDNYRDLSVSGDGSDIVPKLTVNYRLDHRDLVEYPRSGYLVKYQLTRAGFTSSQPRFWRFVLDHRAYLKLSKRVSVGGRNLLRLNAGKLPIYDRIFLGYFHRVRGYFTRRFTAQNYMLQNYEMRISLLPLKYLSWKSAPMMPAFFQQLKYGVSLALFMDSAVLWDRREQLSLRNHFTGFGAGLHFHLPYIYLLRLEHAWNDVGDREWIIDAQVSF